MFLAFVDSGEMWSLCMWYARWLHYPQFTRGSKKVEDGGAAAWPLRDKSPKPVPRLRKVGCDCGILP
jgi:hypothetical protein